MSGATKAQDEAERREAQLWVQNVMENVARRVAAEKRYEGFVTDCNMSFCTHFNEDRRRCSLRKCFYDRKDAISELDDMQSRKSRREIEEAMRWDG